MLPLPSRSAWSARPPEAGPPRAELPLLLALTKTKSLPSSDAGLRGDSAARGDSVACALKPAASGSSRTTPRPGADSSGSSSGYRSDAFAQLTCRTGYQTAVFIAVVWKCVTFDPPGRPGKNLSSNSAWASLSCRFESMRTCAESSILATGELRALMRTCVRSIN